jgi:two-component system sensor histidine kinase KdpD
MRALYEMARELSSALVLEQIEEIGDRFVSSTFGVHAHLLLPDDKGKLPVTLERGDVLDLGIAQWALDHGKPPVAAPIPCRPAIISMFR